MTRGRDQWALSDRGESGSAVVYLVGGVAVLLFALAASVAVARIAQARASTALVADLAALAAADATRVGSAHGAYGEPGGRAAGPCERAEQVAEVNGAELLRCHIYGWDVQVQVRKRVLVLAGPLGEGHWIGTTTQSRAGPAEP